MNTDTPPWNAPIWQNAWRQAAAARDGDALHHLRKEVFTHTVACVQYGGYTTAEGQWVPLPPVDASASRFYDREFRTQPQRRAAETAVRVVAEDCLLTARRLAELGEEVCVLNMANRRTPGGGVLQGCGAQEEYLFRCSNYYTALYRYGWQAQEFGLPPAAEQYPMDRDFGGVFTRGVTIFRGAESEGYPLLPRPWPCNMIAVAALNRPETVLTENGERLVPELVPAAKNKIRTVLRVAADNGQYNLVLGAMGCGAFRNPPAHVAELFAEVLAEAEFRGVFKRVFFSIIEDHNSRGTGNWEPFARVFNPTVEEDMPPAPNEEDVRGVETRILRGMKEGRFCGSPIGSACFAVPAEDGRLTDGAAHAALLVQEADNRPCTFFRISPALSNTAEQDAEVAALFAPAARLWNVRFPLKYQRRLGSDAYMGLIPAALSETDTADLRRLADTAETLRQQGGTLPMEDTAVLLEALQQTLQPDLLGGTLQRKWLLRVQALLAATPAEQWGGLLQRLRTAPNSVPMLYAVNTSREIRDFLQVPRKLHGFRLSDPTGYPAMEADAPRTAAELAQLLHSPSAGYRFFSGGSGDFRGFLVPVQNPALPVFHPELHAEIRYTHPDVRRKHLALLKEQEAARS